MMAASANIPVIDISKGEPEDVARQLVDAAEEHGFIYVKNSEQDISSAAINKAFKVSELLFNESSHEEKQKCSIQTNNRGWSGMHTETLDPKNQKVGDFKEAFNFGEFVNGKPQQPIPPRIADETSGVDAFTTACHNLCQKLLYLLGLGLGVGDFFSAAHDTSKGASSSILRFLRYPTIDPSSHSEDDVRAGAHSDYGSVTLLFRIPGQGGLELLRKDNVWAPVPVSPPGTENDSIPPILVNIGDLLSYWTNGLFRSTVHRVVFPTGGSKGVDGESNSGVRYSMAYFCHPVGSVALDPVPSERVRNFVPSEGTPAENPYAERKVLTADEHLFMRLKASYGTLYDEKKAE